MNRIQIRQTLLNLIGGIAVPPQLEHYELDQFWHEGACELGRRGQPVLWRAAYSTTTAGQATEYPLPADFLRWVDLEPPLIGGNPLTMATQGQLDQINAGWRTQASGGRATAYCVELGIVTAGANAGKRCIRFDPIPDNGLTLLLPYYREPVRLGSLADNTTEYWDLPARWHRVPCLWAVYTWAMDGGVEFKKDPAFLEQRFNKHAEQFRAEFNERMQPAFRATTPEAFSTRFDPDWQEADE